MRALLRLGRWAGGRLPGILRKNFLAAEAIAAFSLAV
jgi:hypothetical protein